MEDKVDVKVVGLTSRPIDKSDPVKEIKFDPTDRSWIFEFKSWTGEVVRVKMVIRDDLRVHSRSMLDKIRWNTAVDVYAIHDRDGATLNEPKRIRTLVVNIADVDVPEDPHQMMSDAAYQAMRDRVIYDSQSELLTASARGWLIAVSNEYNKRNFKVVTAANSDKK